MCPPPKVKSSSATIYLILFTFYSTTFPPSFPLVTTILLSVSVSFCLFVCFSYLFICCFQFYIPPMSEIIWFLAFFRLTYLTEHDILKVHPRCCKWQYFIFSHGWVAFHCIWAYVPHLLYPIIYWRMLWLFPYLGHCKSVMFS